MSVFNVTCIVVPHVKVRMFFFFQLSLHEIKPKFTNKDLWPSSRTVMNRTVQTACCPDREGGAMTLTGIKRPDPSFTKALFHHSYLGRSHDRYCVASVQRWAKACRTAFSAVLSLRSRQEANGASKLVSTLYLSSLNVSIEIITLNYIVDGIIESDNDYYLNLTTTDQNVDLFSCVYWQHCISESGTHCSQSIGVIKCGIQV